MFRPLIIGLWNKRFKEFIVVQSHESLTFDDFSFDSLATSSKYNEIPTETSSYSYMNLLPLTISLFSFDSLATSSKYNEIPTETSRYSHMNFLPLTISLFSFDSLATSSRDEIEEDGLDVPLLTRQKRPLVMSGMRGAELIFRGFIASCCQYIKESYCQYIKKSKNKLSMYLQI